MTTKPLSGNDALDYINNSANSATNKEDEMATKKAAEKISSKKARKLLTKKDAEIIKEQKKRVEEKGSAALCTGDVKTGAKSAKEQRRAPKTETPEQQKTPITSDIKETPEQIKAKIDALKKEAPPKKVKGAGRDKFGWRKGSQIAAMFAALEEKPWLKKDFEEKFKHADGTPGGLWPTPDLKKAKSNGWIVTVTEKGTQITGYEENTVAAENVARVKAEETAAAEKELVKKGAAN